MNGREQTERIAQDAGRMVQMISFSVGAEHFGVPILMIQEIIMMSDITEIPNSPDFVEGVINLRGDIIPVIDLRKRLRLRSGSPSEGTRAGTRILVVEVDEKITGFIVDAVSRVLTVPEARITPPPDIIVAGVQSQYIAGVVHLEDKILIVLDFRRILTLEEKGALEEVSQTAVDSQERLGR